MPAACSRIAAASPPKPLPITAARVRSAFDIVLLQRRELVRQRAAVRARTERGVQRGQRVLELRARTATAALRCEAQALEQLLRLGAACDRAQRATARGVRVRIEVFTQPRP